MSSQKPADQALGDRGKVFLGPAGEAILKKSIGIRVPLLQFGQHRVGVTLGGFLPGGEFLGDQDQLVDKGRQEDDEDQGQKSEEHKEDDQKAHDPGPAAPFAVGGQGVSEIGEQEGDRNGEKDPRPGEEDAPQKDDPGDDQKHSPGVIRLYRRSFPSCPFGPLNPFPFQTLPARARLI